MKIIPPSDLCTDSLQVKFLTAMKYRPKIFDNVIKNRRTNSLLLVLRGEYLYRWETPKNSRELRAGPGYMVYSPAFADYEYHVLTQDTEVIQVEFELIQENKIALSSHPTAKPCPGKSVFFDILRYSGCDNKLKVTAYMYLLLSSMENENSAIYPKIQPAVNYIATNFTSPISVSELAGLCFISESQLCRLFKKNFGMTPTRYKNELLVHSAQELLQNSDSSVNEIASMLGFSDIYSFSHFFKRETGISPSKYHEEN